MLNISRSTTAPPKPKSLTLKDFINRYAQSKSDVHGMLKTLKDSKLEDANGITRLQHAETRWQSEWLPAYEKLQLTSARQSWAERNLEDPIRPYLQRLYYEDRVEECLSTQGPVNAFLRENVIDNVAFKECDIFDAVDKVMAHLRDQKKVASIHAAIYEDENLAPLEECIMDAYGT
jgi:hypothetical protein